MRHKLSLTVAVLLAVTAGCGGTMPSLKRTRDTQSPPSVDRNST